MDIALITYPMDHDPTGVGVLVENLVREITRIDSTNRYTLLHFDDSDHPMYRQNYEIKYPRLHPLPVMVADSLYLARHPRAFDIVHRFSPGGFIFPVRSKRVVTVNDLFLYKTYRFNRNPKVILARWFNRRAIMGADAVIAISKFTRAEVLKTFPIDPAKVHVVYCAPGRTGEAPIDPALLEKTYGIRGRFILFVSTIEPRKNLLTLVKAFERLKSCHNIEESLVIVGKAGGGAEKTLAAIASSPWRNDIHMTGFVPAGHLAAFYANAAVFVYPSWMEGFGIPPLEAMQQHCPVLTSNTSSLPEVVGDHRFMFAPGDVAEMSVKLLRTIRDDLFRNENLKNGARRLAQFSWPTAARQVIAVYQQVAEAWPNVTPPSFLNSKTPCRRW